MTTRHRQEVRDAFQASKSNARRQGIGFEFDLDEWVFWWETQLGPNWLEKRGRNAGQYVMSRKRGNGTYCWGNVECVTNTENATRVNVRIRKTKKSQAPSERSLKTPYYKRTPKSAFIAQKFNAASRGISWEWEFNDWVNWWKENLGPDWFKKRGRRKDEYVMSRRGDKGPYRRDNVFCATQSENRCEAIAYHLKKR